MYGTAKIDVFLEKSKRPLSPSFWNEVWFASLKACKVRSDTRVVCANLGPANNIPQNPSNFLLSSRGGGDMTVSTCVVFQDPRSKRKSSHALREFCNVLYVLAAVVLVCLCFSCCDSVFVLQHNTVVPPNCPSTHRRCPPHLSSCTRSTIFPESDKLLLSLSLRSMQLPCDT